MTPADIVQRQLDTYNAQDLDGFCACFGEDVELAGFNGPVTNRGQASLRERYGGLFKHFPQNHAKILHRAVVGNVVVDHEEIIRAPGQAPFYVVAIYTIEHGLIARADFVRDT
ncbi:nuclear transport factor 2 family protein [Terricaulis sp.]|uniref:nuclear transport factor 2 family protein n=1 Tax=Terricaulis sp. TaxID=2768686 RepID=UPI0037834291